MKIADHVENPRRWHEIKTSAELSLYDVIQWCLDYESDHHVYFVIDETINSYYLNNQKLARILFESKEDALIFALTWLGITGV